MVSLVSVRTKDQSKVGGAAKEQSGLFRCPWPQAAGLGQVLRDTEKSQLRHEKNPEK